jgi:Tfp pilus assembly protein PilV
MFAYSSKKRVQSGQSMLEAIIATGILVTAISSALTLVTSSIKASKESETSITAGNLAREGVEVVRAIRDSNWLAGKAFDDSLFSATDYSGIAIFDPVANSWSINYAAADSTTDSAAKVWRSNGAAAGTTLGLLLQAAAQPTDTTATQFNRIIETIPLCDDGAGSYLVAAPGADCGAAAKIGIDVITRVRWVLGGKERSIVMQERMFDWR